ncbi:MAG TPA: heavy metal-associated domain-containing protein [Oscillatoriaceae cyanobacterium]
MFVLRVNGMTCENCVRHVREALEQVPGVRDVRVDLAEGRATVEGDADPQLLVAALDEEGYEAMIA